MTSKLISYLEFVYVASPGMESHLKYNELCFLQSGEHHVKDAHKISNRRKKKIPSTNSSS